MAGIHWLRRLAPLAVMILPAAAAAQPVRAPIAVTTALEPGMWEVSENGTPPQRLCILDTAALFQVRHVRSDCTRFVIDDGREAATVSYSCQGAGWGRTSLRVVSPRTVRIDTQGIADRAPFAFAAEAKRIGACRSAAATVRRPPS